jgi:hypothetical protein
MKQLFFHFTLSTKLLAATGATLAFVVAIACALVVADHYQDASARVLVETTTQAELIAANAGPALANHDGIEAERVLSALQAAPTVLSARLHDSRGMPVAEYKTSRWSRLGLTLGFPASSGSKFQQEYLEIMRPVFMRGQPVGMLVLASDLTALRIDCVSFGVKAVLIALITLMIAYLLTAAAYRAILEPLGTLASAVRRSVTERRDDVRVVVRTGDEAGVLGEAFNALWEPIVEREAS